MNDRAKPAAALAAIPAHVPAECVVDFDIYNMPGADRDFFGAWKSLLRPGLPDILWTPRNEGHWIVTRGEEIHRLLADWQNLSSTLDQTPRRVAAETQFIPIQLDPPEHTPYRAIVIKALASRDVLSMDGRIRELAGSLIDTFRSRGTCEFIGAFAEILPLTVLMTLIDLPVADAFKLRGIVNHIGRPDGTVTIGQVMGHVHDYLRPYAQERLRRPGNDLLSRILSTPIEGRAWTSEEALHLCANILVAGLDTVVALFGWTMHFLAQNPAHRAQLRANPGLIPAAADEFTRRFGPITRGRLVMNDLVVCGVRMKAGDMVQLPTMLHNLDDRCFAKAEAVDFGRNVTPHSTMGNGVHRCAGAALARVEVIAFLDEWFRRIPEFEIDESRPVTMSGGVVGAVSSLHLRWARPE